MTTNNAVDSPLSGTTGTGNFVGSNSATLITPALGTPGSGTLTSCTGYTVANLSDGAWTDFSGSIGYTGFTGTPTTTIARFKLIGKTCFFDIIMTGTSNATGFTITSMPATCGRQTEGNLVNAEDNNTSVYTGNWTMAASSTTLTMLLSNNATGWTNSGTKAVSFQGFYETT